MERIRAHTFEELEPKENGDQILLGRFVGRPSYNQDATPTHKAL